MKLPPIPLGRDRHGGLAWLLRVNPKQGDLSMQDSSLPKERRKHPRYTIDLPLNFQMTESPNIYAGLIVNASEGGLQIHTMKNMATGLKLNIELFFTMDFELSTLEAMVEVIWKDDHDDVWEKCLGYKYGLKFVRISKENHLKLKHLLRDKSDTGDTSPQGGNPSPVT